MKDFNNLTKEERKQLKAQQRSETAVWLKEVGKRLRNARNDSGMLQSDVSDLLLCSENHSSDIETGLSDFVISELRQLCNTYQISSDTLLDIKSASSDELESVIQKLNQEQREHLCKYAKLMLLDKQE